MNGRIRCGALVLACAFLLALPSGASAKLFLELPGVPGESQVVGFEDQIVLQSFQLGVGNSVGTSSSGQKMAGKASFSEMTVTKGLDRASPELMLRTANGMVSPTARLRLTRTTAEGESTILRYCFTQVRFSGWSQSSGGETPSESLSFSYATIVQSYTQQSGSGSGTVFSSGWDVIANLQFAGACNT
jgi:type VI secretion system secreted protein Hcp